RATTNLDNSGGWGARPSAPPPQPPRPPSPPPAPTPIYRRYPLHIVCGLPRDPHSWRKRPNTLITLLQCLAISVEADHFARRRAVGAGCLFLSPPRPGRVPPELGHRVRGLSRPTHPPGCARRGRRARAAVTCDSGIIGAAQNSSLTLRLRFRLAWRLSQ